MREHWYHARLRWDGNRGDGTSAYGGYSRNFSVHIAGKPTLLGSAHHAFRGDAGVHDPEEWLLAALAGCHMLAYLALCARRGVAVVGYEDAPDGTLVIDHEGGGRFDRVTLRPIVTVADPETESLACELHEGAHRQCFIASSVAFPVTVDATVRSAIGSSA